MSEFDGRAQDWDLNIVHVKRSEAVAEVLQNTIFLKKKMSAMEYGAGTGLLSFILKDRLSRITLFDKSRDMVRVAQDKIAAAEVTNMRAFCIDLENENFSDTFDIIYSQMVMHHVENVQTVLSKFYQMLNSGGYLAIADLFAEDGTFHEDGFTGHLGFDCDELVLLLQKIGFVNVSYKQCYVLYKTNTAGTEKGYPIFLLTASK